VILSDLYGPCLAFRKFLRLKLNEL
jgi:hypothetical protein